MSGLAAATPLNPPPVPTHVMQMPGRSHHSAPKFDGKPWSLKRFLTEVRDLALEKGLTERQTILATLSYAPTQDYELWLSLSSASGEKWDTFVAELCTLYPGSEGDRKYNRENLDTLTRSSALVPMTDHLQFGEYYRSFLTITAFLKSKNRISDQECSSKFLEGLHYRFRAELADYLRIKEPTHHIDDPWALSSLYESALFVLSNRFGAAGFAAPKTNEAPEQTSVKTEVFDASSMVGKYMESEAFLNRMSSILRPVLQGFQPSAHPTYAPQTAPAPPQTPHYAPPPHKSSYNANTAPAQTQQPYPRPDVCVFCSDPKHYQFDCAQAADYIKRGLMTRDPANQLVLPNGTRITARLAPGHNIKERVDNWHRNNSPPSAPLASTNFVDVSITEEFRNTNPWAIFTHEISSARIEDVPDEDAYTTTNPSSIAEALPIDAAHDDHIPPSDAATTVELFGPTTRARAYDAPPPAPANQPRTRENAPHLPTPTTSATNIPSAVTVGAPQVSAPPRSSKNPFMSSANPQYTYHTPIESAETVERVVEQSLDATVTLTNRDLLAVAPEVRKALKDQIATRRSIVPSLGNTAGQPGTPRATAPVVGANTISVDAFLASLIPRNDDIIVANHMEDLRCIKIEVPGGTAVNAILDEGSQIIALRADIWQKTGLPLRTDHLMVMESANQSTNDTKGLLPDFPITIGDFKFYIQVQVVENASYEMLLGRPFLTLCQASTRHFSNGDSHITLVDPNSQAVITLPTHTRVRDPRPAVRVSTFCP
ncbi:hypothetical protein HYPSUDRAFT_919512 [Hypholoma sublateritium FD-334 SS-4]|uniref:Peptidase A2 domain-containing protein n=1 Tax=Hypholoma sublateritium (strain FD-334 SS-4) TaxID=945553 RepID=A0A0D2KVI4_HYPSF|nr:hypothetical protein HYPSUDRAFT_919512 [Hypholoma sublateritium FD-334 SS-4]